MAAPYEASQTRSVVRAKGMSDSHVRFHSMGPFRYVRLELRIHLFSSTGAPNPLGRVQFRRHIANNQTGTRPVNLWCGRRESNPRLQLGKLTCCHYTTPATFAILQKSFCFVQTNIIVHYIYLINPSAQSTTH